MLRRALIVDAEPEVIDQAVEVVESLGHDFVTACSSREAIRRLSNDNYDYVLVGITLPAIRRLGERKPQYAENVLEWLHANRNGDSPPVIMLCNLVPSSPEITVQVMKLAKRFEEKGAAEIIQIPLPTSGLTLDQMIMAELEKFSTTKSMSEARKYEKSKRAEASEKWLTVTEAAEMLLDIISGIDLGRARARVSRAAQRGKFRTNERRGRNRLIDHDSYSAWLLDQRATYLESVD